MQPSSPPRPVPVLTVRDLSVAFDDDDSSVMVADGVSFELQRGRTLGLVGESGCGKSVTALSLAGLVPPPGRIVRGSVSLEGTELVGLGEGDLRPVRGAGIAMVFQEPMTALNPVYSIGDQVAEAYRLHHACSRGTAWGEAVSMLERVGISDPGRRARAYPHQLSGGMRQRAMIAMALVCRPAVLVADEPTTALDVTVQAQILDLILEMQAEFGIAVLFISHDLAVVSEVSDDVAVMYSGRVVERARAVDIFSRPLHPYTQALMETLPGQAKPGKRLPAIPGVVPDPKARPPGCPFAPRCPLMEGACGKDQALRGDDHAVACWKAVEA